MWSLPPTVSRLMTIYPSSSAFFTYTSSFNSLSEYRRNFAPSNFKSWSFVFRILSLYVKQTTVSHGVYPVVPSPSWSGLFENSRRTSFSNPGRPVSSAALSFKVALYLKITFCPYTFSFKSFF